MEQLQTEPLPAGAIAGFWRRLGAFSIDLILLLIIGSVLGSLLFDPLARMGAYARLIGFAIALGYFGICNSRVTGGRTLGKRWLGVRVVDADGQPLSLPRSLLRYIVLGAPFFLGGLTPEPEQGMTSALGFLYALAVGGSALAIAYLYLFNRRTRQSLHDLAVGSYIVRAAPNAATPFPILWHGHLVVLALIAAMAVASPSVQNRLWQTGIFADLLPMQKALASQPHVLNAQVVRGWYASKGSESHYLKSQLGLDAPLINDEALAKRIAQQMAQMDSRLATEDTVLVDLVYGYNMVIASGQSVQRYSFTPDELK